MGSRRGWAVIGIVGSLLLSAAAWVVFDTALLFLIVPFVPYLLGRGDDPDRASSIRTCPNCEYRTTDPSHEYCPHDGSPLRP